MTPERRARELAHDFWSCLSPDERWQLGDDLVLGAFDPIDWPQLEGQRPCRAFMAELDRQRMLWEDAQ